MGSACITNGSGFVYQNGITESFNRGSELASCWWWFEHFKALCWQGLTQKDSRYCANHLQIWLSAGQIEGSTCPAVPICGTDIADFSKCFKTLRALSRDFKKSVVLPLAHQASSELGLPVTTLSHCQMSMLGAFRSTVATRCCWDGIKKFLSCLRVSVSHQWVIGSDSTIQHVILADNAVDQSEVGERF